MYSGPTIVTYGVQSFNGNFPIGGAVVFSKYNVNKCVTVFNCVKPV